MHHNDSEKAAYAQAMVAFSSLEVSADCAIASAAVASAANREASAVAAFAEATNLANSACKRLGVTNWTLL